MFPFARIAIAVVGAVAMALAFPKTNLWMLAPVGAGALFWSWFGLAPRPAFFIGWAAGTVYFSLSLSWFAETAGALIAPFGWVLVVGPALMEGLSFGVAGALCAWIATGGSRRLGPLGAAGAFALCEWARSTGTFGMPFADLAYSQAHSPFTPLAAYVGSFGMTFTICVFSAYGAAALRAGRRRSVKHAAALAVCVSAAFTFIAWLAWPARLPEPRHTEVASIQGNIPQSLKWQPGQVHVALQTYERLTRAVAHAHPTIVLWPETAIAANLNADPRLQARVAQLARNVRANLVVGSLQHIPTGDFNAAYFFGPDGGLDAVYQKRRLVPLVEWLPAENILGRFGPAALVSRLGMGEVSGVLRLGDVRVAPLICWESAFDDLGTSAVRDGAQVLLVATDDAWFGTTAGPYQHAQIAQLRAVETGTWVVRAAQTGISGIIAPDGSFVQTSRLNEATAIVGMVGDSVFAPYTAIGSGAIAIGLLLVVLVAFYGKRAYRER